MKSLTSPECDTRNTRTNLFSIHTSLPLSKSNIIPSRSSGFVFRYYIFSPTCFTFWLDFTQQRSKVTQIIRKYKRLVYLDIYHYDQTNGLRFLKNSSLRYIYQRCVPRSHTSRYIHFVTLWFKAFVSLVT